MSTITEAPGDVVLSASASDARTDVADVATQWAALPGGVVDGGEIVILAIKPSMWRPLFDATPCLVTTCVLAVSLISLGTPFLGLSVMASAQLMIVIGMARLAAAIVYWLPRWHVLTNRRVIDVSGVRTPIISACPLTDVRNTFLRANNIEKMTRLGTILFVTDRADDPPRCWESIADAEAVHTEIRRAIESALDAAGM